ncbi:2Fe-2S iron-sulfur cluster binding domain-containing protein [Olivibacter sp. SDN3]|uniref:2Fe-2S iron-sulfur cluster-binding protein n=1 Tax=Olivibacter sp. SDN3 TaxID=2764720 RepID=UPI001650DE7A|nr:2Fe-2S iron-sulfur cluster-binding protein [Olivibacter sp. SDN3]QNL49126.1 2Fe-2S iron-sulfur cluster binding domain-containing protein [Olivibacter sp. SDN3]
MIHITVEDRNGCTQVIEIPEDINLSLMEILKASEYNILATCGGMALCATCHVEVQAGITHLHEPSEEELDMLDALPDADENSRLACQIRLSEQLDGLQVKIKGTLNE